MEPSHLLEILAMAIPLTFGAAVALSAGRAPFRTALWASGLSALLAVLVAVGFVLLPAASAQPTSAALAMVTDAVRLDGVTVVMLGLVATMALVIVRYSNRQLDGDPHRRRYARALLATVGTVTLLVIAEHLLVLALAWMGTSFALHQLLTHHRERPGAIVAAHEKFLVSRGADVFVLGGIGLLGYGVGSVRIDDIHAWAATVETLPTSVQLAAVLLVLGVSLKTAQLPFHGWLMRVMEAPTPVSALLHAGVVNIGGFVLIRLAPVMMLAEVAMALLIFIGISTAIVSALVMTARPSIKTSLAWSTSAQMGFMLVECGLGAWHLALLHLVVHSFYKAHAFLGSGSTVDQWRVRAMARPAVPTVAHWADAAGVVMLLLAGLAAVAINLEAIFGIDPTLGPMAVLLGLSLLPMVARGIAAGLRTTLVMAALSAMSMAMFLGWHLAFAQVVAPPAQVAWLPWGLVLAALGAQLMLQLSLEARPAGRLARALRPHLLAGLYFDAVFTRLVFWTWPPRLPQPTEAPVTGRPFAEPQEQRA